MATDDFLHNLRAALARLDEAGPTDAQLLGSFVERRDEAAFAALVGRHGTMVWGVCRRLVPSREDAEDAFQATFLVLARKAAGVWPRERVGNWLHGVARHTALQARRTVARRARREAQVPDMPEPAVPEQGPWRDLQPLLDEELRRLPAQYRAVVVLCDLEGRPRKEAARQLGVPEGSVAGWLARARAMLARRLSRRGVGLPAGALAAVLSQDAAAGVPPAVVSSAIEVASLWAAGRAAAPGVVPAKVAALTEGVLKAMLLSKLKLTAVLLLATVATGGAGLTYIDTLRAARATEAAGAAAGDEPAGKRIPTDRDRLQGAWQVVERAVRGGNLEKFPERNQPSSTTKPPSAVRPGRIEKERELEGLEPGRAVFKGDELEWLDMKLTYTLDPSKKPKQMDWTVTGGERKGQRVLGIYEWAGGKLKVCMALPGEDRPTEFKSVDGPPPEGKVWVLVFERVEEKSGK